MAAARRRGGHRSPAAAHRLRPSYVFAGSHDTTAAAFGVKIGFMKGRRSGLSSGSHVLGMRGSGTGSAPVFANCGAIC